jgi:hypothetical protein
MSEIERQFFRANWKQSEYDHTKDQKKIFKGYKFQSEHVVWAENILAKKFQSKTAPLQQTKIPFPLSLFKSPKLEPIIPVEDKNLWDKTKSYFPGVFSISLLSKSFCDLLKSEFKILSTTCKYPLVTNREHNNIVEPRRTRNFWNGNGPCVAIHCETY